MEKLIKLYCTICYQNQDSRIAEKMQHGSNNKSAQFKDVELMTAYLWGTQQDLLTRKGIYNFIRTYHLGDFPKLPSYQAFCRRLEPAGGDPVRAKACQHRAGAWLCAGLLPGHGVRRGAVKYRQNSTGSLQFDAESDEKPVVSRCQAAKRAKHHAHYAAEAEEIRHFGVRGRCVHARQRHPAAY